jgi:hypothetical protein
MSFDFPHVGARREDAGQRFLRFVEQLEQAVSLLESQRIAMQWMGLVALHIVPAVLSTNLSFSR